MCWNKIPQATLFVAVVCVWCAACDNSTTSLLPDSHIKDSTIDSLEQDASKDDAQEIVDTSLDIVAESNPLDSGKDSAIETGIADFSEDVLQSDTVLIDAQQIDARQIDAQQIDAHQLDILQPDILQPDTQIPDAQIADVGSGNSNVWAISFGGTSADHAEEIALDNSANPYVTGGFTGQVVVGITTVSSKGNTDVFATKFSGSSGQSRWIKTGGGSSSDKGIGIAVDITGNAYVAGEIYCGSSIIFESMTISCRGMNDGFVARYANDGQFLGAASFGGSGLDHANGVAVDSSGAAYVIGTFGLFGNGKGTFGSTVLTAVADSDIFVAKFLANGQVPWVKQAGYHFSNIGEDIALDNSANSYVTGGFYQSSLNVYSGKISSAGQISWAMMGGGSGTDWGSGIALDRTGNIYVTGKFSNQAVFGTTTVTSNGNYDMFVAKYSSSGSFSWVDSRGGSDDDYAAAIAIDSSDRVYVTGSFEKSFTFGRTTLSSNGYNDVFVLSWDHNGSPQWSTSAGGTSNDDGNGIVVDSSGNAYVTGTFSTSGLFGNTILASAGSTDVFVWKISNP